MNIRAEITNTFNDKGALVASAALIFDETFIVKNLRVIDGTRGLFVAMPSFKGRDDKFHDTCYPLKTETNAEIQQLVLDAYVETIKSGGQED